MQILTVWVLLGNALPAAAQPDPLTTAERSGFRATSTHAEVCAFIDRLQERYTGLRVETIAVTAEGRPVPMMIIGDPVPPSPLALQHDDRLVVYFQANIHAGEVEGKAAALMLAREILAGRTPDYLDRLVILITPDFNPDGNDRISTANRTNQNGPVEGVGIRYNGLNLDLNRDGIKLESPETRGLVTEVLNRWDPAFFLDSHTHNGSYHAEPVTWTWGLNPNGDEAIFTYLADRVMPEVNRRMSAEYGTPCIPHGDFADAREPAQGWVPLGPQPRYLSNYVGLRNRLAVLNENYPYADFETRVQGCYNLFRCFLDYLHENRDEIAALVAGADSRSVARGLEPGPGEDFVLTTGTEPVAERITIAAYEMEEVEVDGRRRQRPTDRVRVIEDIPYFARYVPQRTIPFPAAWLIPVPDDEILDVLLVHGITVERLIKNVTLEVERFTVTQITPATRLNQGHYPNAIEGAYAVEERELPAGTLVIPAAQPLGSLAATLLEAESDDGLAYWNAFDRYLARQWGGGPMLYPVLRLLRPTPLPTRIIRYSSRPRTGGDCR